MSWRRSGNLAAAGSPTPGKPPARLLVARPPSRGTAPAYARSASLLP
jgi:hypothetical protein